VPRLAWQNSNSCREYKDTSNLSIELCSKLISLLEQVSAPVWHGLKATAWPVIEPHVAKIAQALDECEADTVTKVDCGKFILGRFRKTAAPSP
jgi:hypothetical protein